MKPTTENCEGDFGQQQQQNHDGLEPVELDKAAQIQTQQRNEVLLQDEEIEQSPRDFDSLNGHEEEAIAAFRARCPSVSRSVAVKFLAARKFSVERAVELLRQHEAVRRREGLTAFQPTCSPLREELDTAKFTVLPWRDQQGAAITMFTAGRHRPSTSTHRTTLAGVVYQLDVALENPLTQRDGIVFVYNMAGSRYEHFDYELCQKILQLLKGAYPARLKKVLIVAAPLWFRAPFKILRLFVREKLRDRVMIVSQAQLVQHIPPASLPVELGGTQPLHDHHAWLLHCLKVHKQQLSNGTASHLRDISGPLTLLHLDDNEDLIDIDDASEKAVDSATVGRSRENPDANNCHKNGRDREQRLQAGNGASCEDLFLAKVNSNRVSNGAGTDGLNVAPADNGVGNNIDLLSGPGDVFSREPAVIEQNERNNGFSGQNRPEQNASNGQSQNNHTVTPEEAVEEDDSSLVSANSIATAACWAVGAPPGAPPASAPGAGAPQSAVSAVPHVQHVPAGIIPPPPTATQARTPPALEPPRDLTMEEFILDLQKKGRKGLCREYAEIKAQAPAGTFEAARDKMNQSKNRYTDVLCLDHSRVRLPMTSSPEAAAKELADVEDADLISASAYLGTTDYINANFVDGYAGSRAFISTQGPLPRTFPDFWKMIWEEKCGVIVMTTRCIERSRTKCGQYWPPAEGEEHEHGQYRIANQGVEAAGDYQVTELQVSLKDSTEDGDTESEATARTVWHLQFLSWPDYGVPESAFAMLSFRDVCLQKQRDTIRELESRSLWFADVAPQGPPIVVHCSAGIGRTGTFITLDTCIRRLEAESRINVRGTVEAIRAQRAFSIQMPDQYVFCHLALLEYALIHGHLNDVDLSGFDDSSDESADEQH